MRRFVNVLMRLYIFAYQGGEWSLHRRIRCVRGPRCNTGTLSTIDSGKELRRALGAG